MRGSGRARWNLMPDNDGQRMGAAFREFADWERAFGEAPAALSLLHSLSATEALSRLIAGY